MDPSNLILAYVLIALGFVLLAADLFLTSGLVALLALGCIGTGVGMTLYHDTTVGLVTLVSVMVALPLFAGLLLHVWPKTRVGKKMFLPDGGQDATVAELPVNRELELLRGRFGRAVSDLRPSGVTDFDGWRVDTITEGMMVEAGRWVRCVDVRAGKVIVRPAEPPLPEGIEELLQRNGLGKAGQTGQDS